MRGSWLGALLLAGLTLGQAAPTVKALPPPTPVAPSSPGRAGDTPLFPLSALVPGQQGYALTAGAGNRLERFSLEVIALQYDVGTRFPLVLVQTSGELIERAGGIAAGMSGSPVYLSYGGEDALLGAIGFTFPDSGGGLALVTPVGAMRQTEPHLGDWPAAFGPRFDPRAAVPVRTPLLLDGLSGRAAAALAPLFEAQGVPTTLRVPTQLQVQHATPARPPPYAAADRAFEPVPGAPVSVQLVRGDITVAAVGTLTLLEGERFWAFGHPLLGQGEVSFALAPAYVSAVVPSRTLPFKLADSGQRVLGTVTQDRPAALSGTLGSTPDFIPVTLTLQRGETRTTTRFEVAGAEALSAPLLASASLQALDDLLNETNGGTAELAWELPLRGGRTVRLLAQTTDPSDIAFVAASLAAEPLARLATNPFRAPEVERVALNITLERTERVAEIADVVLEGDTVPQGGSVGLNVRLQPYRQDPDVRTVRVRLPEDLEGEVELTVRGGLTPPGTEDEALDAPLSFEELLAGLEGSVQARELVVETSVDGASQILTRQLLPYLVAGSETHYVTVEAPEEAPEDAPEDALEGAPPTPEADPPSVPEAAPDTPPDEPPGDEPPLEDPPLTPSPEERP